MQGMTEALKSLGSRAASARWNPESPRSGDTRALEKWNTPQGYHLVADEEQSDGDRTVRRWSLAGRRQMYFSQGTRYNQSEDLPDQGAMTCMELLRCFINSKGFQGTMALIIMGNAVVIGLETDVKEFHYWNLIENVFLALFTMEVGLRVFSYGPTAFFTPGPDMAWNVFDFFIVALGVVDMLMGLLCGHASGGAGAATALRVVRLLRILRIFRIVRFMKQLYMLAFGFLLAAEAIAWVTILMLFVLYVCSIIMVRSVESMEEDTPDRDLLEGSFGTVFQSMFSLFELMVNPYLQPYHGVIGRQPLITCFILGFVIFGSFGMIALLTGVIHENMFEKNQLRAEEERCEREQKRKILIERCGDLFEEVDTTGAGVPKHRYSELDELLPKVAELFKVNGCQLVEDDLYGIIELMDANGSGHVDKEEFCHFFLRIAEGVRPLLLMEFRQEIMSFIELKFKNLGAEMKETMAMLASKNAIDGISSDVRYLSQQVKQVAQQMSSGAELANAQATLLEAISACNNNVATLSGRCAEVPMQRFSEGPDAFTKPAAATAVGVPDNADLAVLVTSPDLPFHRERPEQPPEMERPGHDDCQEGTGCGQNVGDDPAVIEPEAPRCYNQSEAEGAAVGNEPQLVIQPAGAGGKPPIPNPPAGDSGCADPASGGSGASTADVAARPQMSTASSFQWESSEQGAGRHATPVGDSASEALGGIVTMPQGGGARPTWPQSPSKGASQGRQRQPDQDGRGRGVGSGVSDADDFSDHGQAPK